jgi:hypothetical protein
MHQNLMYISLASQNCITQFLVPNLTYNNPNSILGFILVINLKLQILSSF